jgi:hypothetical protein
MAGIEPMSASTLLRYGALPFFICMAGLRCYLETGVFGAAEHFSYYVFFHHVLWYLSAMLGGMLVLGAILKLSFEKLNLLFYSAVIFMVPILYAYMTGEKLRLVYLKPDVAVILKAALSACLFHPSNKAQFIEILIIDAGVLGFGFFHTRSWKRSILAVLAVHGVLTGFGIQWFYSKPGSPGLIKVATRLSNHVWLALVWLLAATFLAQVFLFKSLMVRKPGMVFAWIATGLVFWAAASYCLGMYAKGSGSFDIPALMLPAYTLGVFTGPCLSGKPQGPAVKAVLGASLLVQLLVVMPVLLNVNPALTSKPIVVPF